MSGGAHAAACKDIGEGVKHIAAHLLGAPVSELQLRDVRNLLGVGCELDYLRRQAERLGVDELLKEVEATHESDE